MKLKYISAAALAAISVLFSSCAQYPGQFGTVSFSTDGYNSSVGWTNARYDANGFPIFGYSNGRPVYGYTEAGAAIFTVAALTALCFVPRWKPAPWYHGHWHHPAHCRPVAAPPRHFRAAPAHRPLAAPLHKPALRPQAGHRPSVAPGPVSRPHMAGRPQSGRPGAVAARPGGTRPIMARSHSSGNSLHMGAHSGGFRSMAARTGGHRMAGGPSSSGRRH